MGGSGSWLVLIGWVATSHTHTRARTHTHTTTSHTTHTHLPGPRTTSQATSTVVVGWLVMAVSQLASQPTRSASRRSATTSSHAAANASHIATWSSVMPLSMRVMSVSLWPPLLLPLRPLPCGREQHAGKVVKMRSLLRALAALALRICYTDDVTAIETELKPPKRARALSRPQQQTPAPLRPLPCGRPHHGSKSGGEKALSPAKGVLKPAAAPPPASSPPSSPAAAAATLQPSGRPPSTTTPSHCPSLPPLPYAATQPTQPHTLYPHPSAVPLPSTCTHLEAH